MKMASSFAILSLLFVFTPVLAENSKQVDKDLEEEYILPETEGVYNVPGHPEMKLKVFVYKDKKIDNSNKSNKPVKPSPDPEPIEPVCGLADPDSSYTTGATSFYLASSPEYKINLNTVPNSVGADNLEEIVANSFAPWESASGLLTYNVGETTISKAKRDNQWIIAWGRASSGTLAITYTWYYPDTGIVIETDMIMNSLYPWKWSNPATWGDNPTCAYEDAFDAQNIMTHEFGHWYGLTDHYSSEYADNTMYGYGSMNETKKDSLTAGDIVGIKAIYGIE